AGGSPGVVRLDPRGSGASRTPRAVVAVDSGDRVTHDSFGLGTVLRVEGFGDRAMAHVDFGEMGVKRLLLRYAPLEKL
nr:hypothetical protein [Actinomycetota bacterium]